MKNLFTKKNANLFIGLLTFLILLWVIVYFIPSIFVNLFNSFLGLGILGMFILILSLYNKKIAIGMTIFLIIIYQIGHMKISNKS